MKNQFVTVLYYPDFQIQVYEWSKFKGLEYQRKQTSNHNLN